MKIDLLSDCRERQSDVAQLWIGSGRVGLVTNVARGRGVVAPSQVIFLLFFAKIMAKLAQVDGITR